MHEFIRVQFLSPKCSGKHFYPGYNTAADACLLGLNSEESNFAPIYLLVWHLVSSPSPEPCPHKLGMSFCQGFTYLLILAQQVITDWLVEEKGTGGAAAAWGLRTDVAMLPACHCAHGW